MTTYHPIVLETEPNVERTFREQTPPRGRRCVKRELHAHRILRKTIWFFADLSSRPAEREQRRSVTVGSVSASRASAVPEREI